jgi:hypothetical protein
MTLICISKSLVLLPLSCMHGGGGAFQCTERKLNLACIQCLSLNEGVVTKGIGGRQEGMTD